MKTEILRRAIVCFRRNARLCLPALALALALGTAVLPPPATGGKSPIDPPARIPLVNWNS